MTEDIPALIADARQVPESDAYPVTMLVHELADALEAEHARAEFLYQDILSRAIDTKEQS